MTPRQIAACLYFAQKRKRREQAEAINAALLGARGQQKHLKEAFSDLADDE